MMKLPQTLTDFNLFLDGGVTRGVVSEIKLPDVAFETLEKNLSGYAGSFEVLTGRVGKLDAEIVCDSYAVEPISALIGSEESAQFPVILRGSLRSGGEDKGLKIIMQGVWSKYSQEPLKVNGEVKNRYSLSLQRYAAYHGAFELFYFDLPTWTIRTGGIDRTKDIRANLGM